MAFSVPSRDVVELLLLDAAGHEAGQVFKGSLPAGHHEVLWSRAGLLSGTYSLQLRSGSLVSVLHTVVL